MGSGWREESKQVQGAVGRKSRGGGRQRRERRGRAGKGGRKEGRRKKEGRKELPKSFGRTAPTVPYSSIEAAWYVGVICVYEYERIRYV